MSLKRKPILLGIMLGSVLLAATAVLLALKWKGSHSRGISDDAKVAIHKFLAKQTGQKNFEAPFNFELANRVTVLRSNVNLLEQHIATIQVSIRAAEADEAPLLKQIGSLREELAKVKRAVGESRTRLKTAEDRKQPNRNEIEALRAGYAKNDGAWTAKRTELGASETQLETTRKPRESLARQIQELEKELHAARAEAKQKEDELDLQENTYIASTRSQINQASTYEAIYGVIGQQLSAADRLLATRDPTRQRIGVRFTREACRHAQEDALHGWLAGRICEAYLWPNLDWADYTRTSKDRAQDVLQYCHSVFSTLADTNSIIRNYELRIVHATSLRDADDFRLRLADVLEQTGDYKKSESVLTAVRETTAVQTAKQSLTRIRKHLSASK